MGGVNYWAECDVFSKVSDCSADNILEPASSDHSKFLNYDHGNLAWTSMQDFEPQYFLLQEG